MESSGSAIVSGQAETKPLTQAEKWLQTLKDRTAHITGFETQGAVADIVARIDIDFPNGLFKLVDSRTRQWVGMRRLFGDRSVADALFADGSIGKITCDVLSDGMVGAAQNGRIITNLN
ncbi:MAG TPA: hypothetical protein VJ577_11355 [Burkholderiaceae bacterium]|nr:hypothetical protein [Burkholderiaceae bacterium]